MTAFVSKAVASMSPFGAGLVANLSGVPWGATLVITLGALLVALVYAVMPQESPDRLSWWQSLWERNGQRESQRRPDLGVADDKTTPGALPVSGSPSGRTEKS